MPCLVARSAPPHYNLNRDAVRSKFHDRAEPKQSVACKAAARRDGTIAASLEESETRALSAVDCAGQADPERILSYRRAGLSRHSHGRRPHR